MCMEKNPMRQAKKKARKPLILLGLRAIEFWCRWWDSNPHTLADNRFWVCLVCQFRHTGIYIFKSYPGWSLWEIGGPSWGDIKNHLHIELSNSLGKSRVPAEVVTTDEWDFESVASAIPPHRQITCTLYTGLYKKSRGFASFFQILPLLRSGFSEKDEDKIK